MRLTMGAFLLAVAIVAIPLIDNLGLLEVYSAASKAFGRPIGSKSPVLTIIVAVSLAILAFRWTRSPGKRRRRLSFFILAAVVACLTVYSTAKLALKRGNAVLFWEVCETWEPSETQLKLMEYGPRESPFEGPHLPTGAPCTSQEEGLSIHDDVSVMDGLRQIAKRFPKDRARAFYVPPINLLLLLVSGILIVGCKRDEPTTPTQRSESQPDAGQQPDGDQQPAPPREDAGGEQQQE
jgi:uncharacterized membrane protein SirB2